MGDPYTSKISQVTSDQEGKTSLHNEIAFFMGGMIEGFSEM